MLLFAVANLLSAQTRKRGDVNYDDKVDISDVVAVINIIAGAEYPDEPVGGLRTQFFDVNGVNFTMIPVEGGRLFMGAVSSSGASSDEYPLHHVFLSDFYIGETEVTQELWQAVMGSTPSGSTGSANLPVVEVSWNDCQSFITKLNELTGQNFRLPTEAEWEYAAVGGLRGHGYIYSGSANIEDVAWYYWNTNLKRQEVATKKWNELGIYDMSGNVWEWCQDWYDSSYYSSSKADNPTGPSSGSYRVYRGGGFRNEAKDCRKSKRGHGTPGFHSYDLGLRLAL